MPLTIAPALSPPTKPPHLPTHPSTPRAGAQTLVDGSTPWWLSEVLLGLQDLTMKQVREAGHPHPAGFVSPGILSWSWAQCLRDPRLFSP